MKIHAVTPTRGDRPVLLERAKLYLSRQTLLPEKHHIIDFAPTDGQKDITKRFRIGLERAFAEGADLVFLWEDDDWYHPDYVARMAAEWERAGRPSCVGIAETYYYHIKIKGWMHMRHLGRASAFCTALSPAAMSIKWPADTNPFFDIEVWKQLGGHAVLPDTMLALGIKGHEKGILFGGNGHNEKWIAYKNNKDNEMKWLKNIVKEDFIFYENLSNAARNTISKRIL